MMQRSRQSQGSYHYAQQGTANASWDDDDIPPALHHESSTPAGGAQSSSSFGKRSLLKTTLKQSPTTTTPGGGNNTASSSTKSYCVIEDDKLTRLLEILRSNEFVGTIDPRHHSRYLSSPTSSTSTTTSPLMARMAHHASFAKSHGGNSSFRSQFKDALKKNKSTSQIPMQPTVAASKAA